MDYDCKGRDWCLFKLKDLGFSDIERNGEFFIAKNNKITVLYYYNWPKVGRISDRGGLLRKRSTNLRRYACFEPQHFVGINYDGTVSPCCNIRNDAKQHQPYVLGDLKVNSLEEILTSPKAIKFRENCANNIFKQKSSPCKYCNNIGGRYTIQNGGITAYEHHR